MEVITIRVPEDDLAVLRQHGIQPAVLCRERIHQEALRLRLRVGQEFLDAVAVKPPKPLVDMVREDRDAR